MNAARLIDGTGPWYSVVTFAALFVVAVLGCWFGSPPEQRKGIVREVRREREIRRWQREQRQTEQRNR